MNRKNAYIHFFILRQNSSFQCQVTEGTGEDTTLARANAHIHKLSKHDMEDCYYEKVARL